MGRHVCPPRLLLAWQRPKPFYLAAKTWRWHALCAWQFKIHRPGHKKQTLGSVCGGRWLGTGWRDISGGDRGLPLRVLYPAVARDPCEATECTCLWRLPCRDSIICKRFFIVVEV